MTRPIRNPAAAAAQGAPAGFVSRVIAVAIDTVAAYLVYVALVFGVTYLIALLTERATASIENPPTWVTLTVAPLLFGLYCALAWASTGRTIGDQVMGLRVVGLDGRRLRFRAALWRVVCCATFGWWGLAWSLLSRRNAGVHDLVARTAVLYDWRYHDPEPVEPGRAELQEPAPAADVSTA